MGVDQSAIDPEIPLYAYGKIIHLDSFWWALQLQINVFWSASLQSKKSFLNSVYGVIQELAFVMGFISITVKLINSSDTGFNHQRKGVFCMLLCS